MKLAGDQSVTHTIDKHQFPKLMNQVVKRDNILPVMIRLPNEVVNRLNCKTGKLSGYVECAVVLAEDVVLHTGRVRFMEHGLTS